MTTDHQDISGSETKEDGAKKQYATPKLIVHGAVQKLTEKTGPGLNQDGINANRS